MSPEFIVVVALFAIAWRVIRSVMSSGGMEQARRTAEKLAGEMRDPARPGSPHVAWPGPRPGVRLPAGRQQVATPQQPGRKSTAIAPNSRMRIRHSEEPDAWYLVLDVSPDADRGEIQEAVRRRLSRARADRDNDGVRRVIQAAATGLRAPRRARD